MRDGDTPHPRVFWEKSAQSIENKGREVGKERQESSRVRKRLEVKEIGEVEEVKEFKRGVLLGRGAGETKVRRVFTSYDRTDYRSCQYLYWVLVFRDWAQNDSTGNARVPSQLPLELAFAEDSYTGLSGGALQFSEYTSLGLIRVKEQPVRS